MLQVTGPEHLSLETYDSMINDAINLHLTLAFLGLSGTG